MPGKEIIRTGDRMASMGSPVIIPIIGPLAADAERVVAEETMIVTAGRSQDLTIAAAKPDPTCPRVLSYSVVTDAGAPLLTADFTTVGVDWWGETKTEIVTGVTLAGGAQLGTVPFRTVTSCNAKNASAADTDAGDSVAVGIGAHFSPTVKVKDTDDFIAGISCAAPATASTAVDDLAAGGAATITDANQGYSYYTPNDVPDAIVWYWLHVISTYGGVK